MNYKFSNLITLRFNDFDMLGHLYNAVYQELYDYSRLQYFKKIIGSGVDFKNYGLVHVSLNVNFFEPIFLQDDITVFTKVIKIGNKSITMAQEMRKNGFDKIVNEAKSTLVCYDMIKKNTIAVPENWREKILQFERS